MTANNTFVYSISGPSSFVFRHAYTIFIPSLHSIDGPSDLCFSPFRYHFFYSLDNVFFDNKSFHALLSNNKFILILILIVCINQLDIRSNQLDIQSNQIDLK